MESVTLSYAENRYRWGDLISTEPSRFIEEIDDKYIEIPRKASTFGHSLDFRKIRGADSAESFTGMSLTGRKLKKITPGMSQPSAPGPSAPADELNQLQTGMMVEHERFGQGKVLQVEGEGSNRKATVFFPAVGQKQLLLKFAKLRIL
jgi:DNA helicase-2/ATP-dependent DNA helicase PcrA